MKKPTMARQRHIVAYEWALAQPMFPTRLQISEIMKTTRLKSDNSKLNGVSRVLWGTDWDGDRSAETRASIGEARHRG